MLQLKKNRKYFKSNMFSDCCYSVHLFLLNRTRHATSPTNILMRVGWILLKDSWIRSAQLKINHTSVTSVGSFSHLCNFNIHLYSLSEEKHDSCDECEKSFTQSTNLKTRHTHTREKPCICQCGRLSVTH